ncbi:hypothetical protein MES4922_160002 [Mesorhizobium ventifaucium]|uniref:Uncharacterized protein n=1 Tax=Mesorhizobium ventifaucium TaxID=666020 RepID=A0ABM9DHI8_9HYPH|nr:hypothetical protein MES4922_160002 [Mesorhizobium ventifaucium]
MGRAIQSSCHRDQSDRAAAQRSRRRAGRHAVRQDRLPARGWHRAALGDHRLHGGGERPGQCRPAVAGHLAVTALDPTQSKAEADLVDILNVDGTIKPPKDWPPIWRTGLSSPALRSASFLA